MKNILLPTDFSDNAYNAIEYAVQLFKNEDCTFHLLNTYTPISYSMATLGSGFDTMMMAEVTRNNSENGLLEIEKKLKEKFNNPKHTFQRQSSFNLLVNEIETLIETRNIDLIVMGTKGATGAQEIFLGTNTVFTIKKAKCAVIAVPQGYIYKEPKDVLFPTDFKFAIENKYLTILRAICEEHKSVFRVLNVYLGRPLEAAQQNTKEKLEGFFEHIPYIFHEEENMDITDAVEEFQIKHKIDFLVMIKNKHSIFENLLFKPVVNQMVYHTNVPFMVIPSMELLKK
jgi:nucleotide-binding universal stress UspA family protein